MKTKNAPKDLKCKINDAFFLETGVPNRGGGSDTREKFPKNPVFFWVASFRQLLHFLLTCYRSENLLQNADEDTSQEDCSLGEAWN